jgi:hypothetical protein
LPALTKFFHENQDKRDRFEVFAFHEDAAKSWAELEPRLKPIKEKHWGGKDLPFPILFDSTGKTITTWGIRSFPTFVLIDPEGRVVKGGNLKMLERELSSSSRF